jgi:hypothetical protein
MFHFSNIVRTKGDPKIIEGGPSLIERPRHGHLAPVPPRSSALPAAGLRPIAGLEGNTGSLCLSLLGNLSGRCPPTANIISQDSPPAPRSAGFLLTSRRNHEHAPES